MHISLTPALEKIIKKKVDTGLYNNASEVVREALRLMDKHDEIMYQFKLKNLQDALIEGEQSGNSSRSVQDIIDSKEQKQ